MGQNSGLSEFTCRHSVLGIPLPSYSWRPRRNLGWGRRSISWSTSSCTWLTSLLALAAEVRNPLARCDLRYPRSAARAGLPALAMHPLVVAIVVVRQPLGLHPLRHDGDGPLHHRPHRTVERVQRLVRQLRAPPIRVEARLPQHLVRVGVADD